MIGGVLVAKAALTLDEINLLKNSEEPKDIKLYGNLYEILCQLENPKAIALNELTTLDDMGKAALTYNKKTLFDTVIKEWYAESVSEEDPAKKVRCGLCNTPNKYLFYIRNRKNNMLLNVGSHCITKFPGIDNYIEQKKQLSQIHKGHLVIKRRNEFYEAFPGCEQFISDANNYFNTLPVLLSYYLYSKLQDNIDRMRLIYIKYVNEGKKPFTSELNSLELFQLAVKQYNKLKEQSDAYVKNNINKPLICRRKEIDWLIHNNKQGILDKISKNGGIYTVNTLKHISFPDFVKEHADIIITKNESTLFAFEKFGDNNIIFSFNKFGYQPPILFSIPLDDLMEKIGAYCLIDSNYKYGGTEILNTGHIINSKANLNSVLNYTYNMIDKFNCAFLVDDETDSLFLYRKGDRAVRNFNPYEFLIAYCKYILLPDNNIEQYLFSIVRDVNSTRWISHDQQEKQGVDYKIQKLYKEYSENHTYVSRYNRAHNQIEIVLYNTMYDSHDNCGLIDFNKPEYVTFQRGKIKISDKQLNHIDFGIRIIDDTLEPFYHKGSILFIQNTQNIRNNDIIFYVSTDGINIKKCYIKEKNENIFNCIGIAKRKVKSYGKIIYSIHKNI